MHRASVWTRRLCLVNLYAMRKALQFLTDENGEKTAVVVPLSDYEKLLEDLEDLAVVAERRGEASVPHEEFIAQLKRDGLL